MEVYVPVPEGNGRLAKAGRFSLKSFSYDAGTDAYHCPAGELLHQMKGRWRNTSGRTEIRYASRKAICETCQLRARFVTPKAPYAFRRWEHEDRLDRHRAPMQGADELMRRRSAIVEHPFGTPGMPRRVSPLSRSRFQQSPRRMRPGGPWGPVQRACSISSD